MYVARIRVGVLMGGMSAEQEVSFNSGRTVCDHLDTSMYDIVPLFQRHDGQLFILPYKFLHRGKISDFVDRLAQEAEKIMWDDLSKIIDFMYLAIHGRYAEDGTVQGMLEILQIPYLGSRVYASALCMDKVRTKKILTMHSIVVPRDIVVPPYFSKDSLLLETIHKMIATKNITYPCIVKPRAEGSSIGISIVRSDDDMIQALQNAWSVNTEFSQDALIEECVSGMEFSCILLRDYKNNCWLPLPPTEIVPEDTIGFFDYEQKYMPGRGQKFTPARCNQQYIEKIQNTCIRASDILEIRTISRIDGFLQSDGTVVIIDPNTLSGMGPASFLFREAAEINMSHAQLINHLIETELYQYTGDVVQNINNVLCNNIGMQNMKKKRIAVLFGGDSNEREISLESGRNVIYKLSPHRYEVIPLFVTDSMELYQIGQSLLVRNATHEIQTLIERTEKIAWHSLSNIADFVFIALHGGKGENGTIQGALELLKMPYNGSAVLASALCMDKYKTTTLLASHGVPTPKNILITQAEWYADQQMVLAAITDTFVLPCILKPHDDGCSVLVHKINSKEELITTLDHIFEIGRSTVLVEELICGMELTIGVVGNQNPYALPPSQAVAHDGILSLQEKFLPGAGHNITPAPLLPEALILAQETVVAAYKIAGCAGYARIDCFYQDEHQSITGKPQVVILEINSLPALTPATCIFHQAAEIGISPMQFLDMIIELGFERYQHRINSSVVSSIEEVREQIL